jgi:hypothetical protein
MFFRLRTQIVCKAELSSFSTIFAESPEYCIPRVVTDDLLQDWKKTEVDCGMFSYLYQGSGECDVLVPPVFLSASLLQSHTLRQFLLYIRSDLRRKLFDAQSFSDLE